MRLWHPADRGRLFAALVFALIFAAILFAPTARDTAAQPVFAKQAGWLLVATPRLNDPRFAGTVVLMLRHDAHGAQGVIVNRLISTKPVGEVMERMLGRTPEQDTGATMRIHYGGPLCTGHWSYVHSADYAGARTSVVNDTVSLTSNPEIFEALARGEGPAKGFLVIGHAGWGPDQLDNEIRRQDWIIIPPDGALVLEDEQSSKWRPALERRSLDL